MAEMLSAAANNEGEFVLQPRKGGEEVKVGDTVYLCENAGKKDSAIIGKARVSALPADREMPAWQSAFWIGEATDNRDSSRLEIRLINMFSTKVRRPGLLTNPILKALAFAKSYRTTMAFMTPEQAAELDRIAGQKQKRY